MIMRKLWVTKFVWAMCTVCFAQTPRDTVKLDTAHVEKIYKMPMDTFNSNMPVAPLQGDTTRKGKNKGDDADPKRLKEPNDMKKD
jgi:hypothetical protein